MSALARPQSRFPRRIPGPVCPVIVRWTWLRSTTKPSRLRCSGPSVRSRIVHDPGGAGELTGTFCVTGVIGVR